MFFFFKQKTAYEMRISDWSSDVCSSDLALLPQQRTRRYARARDKFDQQRPARRCLQIFDDMRLDPGVADHGQCIARGHALRVMVDDDVGHFALRQQQESSARRGSPSSESPGQQYLARKTINPVNASMFARWI